MGWEANRALAGVPIHYERRRPEQTTLYRLVQAHAATFFADVEAATGASLPEFVKDEFDAYLECGILAHGFLRLHCSDCGHDKLVAFSCKRRGFCPSCGARRMAQTAAHLVDHVIPHVPVRQWVLSLPIPLRLLMAAHPQLLGPVLQVVHHTLTRFSLKQAGLKASQADSGAVTLIQRFGSAANLNVHLHCLVLDGVYRRTDQGPVFVDTPAPTDDAVLAVLHKIIARLLKMLVRHGTLIEDQGSAYLADIDPDGDDARTLTPLQAAACSYRIAFGPRAGHKILTLQRGAPREAPTGQALCANAHGFSLHAAVRCDAHERQSLEQLCRYITRPALADERVQRNAVGDVVLKLKTAWRDGTTHLVMSPLEFMQRLAALVPRPRLHLIRFHGVLAPNSKLRASVVPVGPDKDAGASERTSSEPGCSHRRPVRISWARLLRRVFAIDLEHCPNCAGALKIIAAILEAPVIEHILSHLGLPARAPPRSAPRAALNAA